MAKDILLFGYIYSYNAMFLFDQIREATEDDPEAEMVLRINTSGGEPDYMLSMAEKIQEISGQLSVKVGPQCHSSGLFLLPYIPVERVDCLDVTQAVLHRAAYPSWIEKSAEFPDSSYESLLVKTNKDMEKAFRNRADVEALESLPQMKEKNLTLKDIFSLDTRIDVVLSGADLKKIGLVNRVVKLTPAKVEAMNSAAAKFTESKTFGEIKMAASAVIKSAPTASQDDDKSQNEHTIMDLNELKTKFPGIYAQAKAEGHAEGVTAGVAAEKDRVEAIMVYADVDAEACKAAVESGKPLSAKQMAEFNRKMISKEALAGAESDSADGVTTGDPKEVGKEKEKAASAKVKSFEDEVNGIVGLKKK